jgi:predicted SprT family Zn-dependent metalloprotease
MARYVDSNKQYHRLMRDPCQPRRTRKAVKQIALSEIRNAGLSRRVRVRVTKDLASPFARAQYIPKGNRILLHPVNTFAKASDLRGVIDHELTHYRDESRKHPRAKKY